MYDLMDLHRAIAKELSNETITEAEAEVLYDTVFNEQVNDLILDIYESFVEGDITSAEANAFLTIATEAVKGDKLSKGEKNKIDDELDNLPEKERKAVEDSIKKASKESGKSAASKVDSLAKIDKVLKSKKDEKVKKESAEVTETAASESREKLHDARKEYREAMKACNKAISDKDYTTAKKELGVARSELKKLSAEVADLDSNVGGVVVSAICESLISGFKATVVGTGINLATNNVSVTGTRGGRLGDITADVVILTDALKALYGIIKSVKNKGYGEIKDFNATKAKVIGTIDALEKLLDQKEKAIDALEKKEKEKKK